MSDSTIDVYARAVRRIARFYDCCPDRLEAYFAERVRSHSGSTVKVDRNGLEFFYKHILKRDWSWVEIIKAPKIQSLPDILTVAEVEHLIGATHKLRYRAFLLATYSMGLRLGETLALEVAISTANASRCISGAGRDTKIAWFRCPTSPTTHCVPCGVSTPTPGFCFLRPSTLARPLPTWIAVVRRLR